MRLFSIGEDVVIKSAGYLIEGVIVSTISSLESNPVYGVNIIKHENPLVSVPYRGDFFESQLVKDEKNNK